MSDFRNCAGIVVFNSDKKVLVCARKEKRGLHWQFPQGGIMKKELPAVAAARELKEETSVSSVKLVKALDQGYIYEFPKSVRNRFERRGIKTKGQKMFWHLFYFYGSDDEINLNTKVPEFKAFEWVEFEEALSRIVYFKKAVYEKAAEAFVPMIETYLI